MEKFIENMTDRVFDVVCLEAKGETEWSDQIMAKLKETYPDYSKYQQACYHIFSKEDTSILMARADYMVQHRDTIKLDY